MNLTTKDAKIYFYREEREDREDFLSGMNID